MYESSVNLLIIVLLCVLAFIVVCKLAYKKLSCKKTYKPVYQYAYKNGGNQRRFPEYKKNDKHVIVDLLNITHWYNKSLTSIDMNAIFKTIDITAPILKKRWPGKVTYVVKDRTHSFNDEKTHALYAESAERNRVVICIAEQYKDPPISANTQRKKHSAAGRDDFYMCLLAQREKAVLLTGDRLKDFNEFRSELPPFHVLEFSYVRHLPTRDFIRPESVAYAKLRRPKIITPAEVFI